jgi:hypothetical protein
MSIKDKHVGRNIIVTYSTEIYCGALRTRSGARHPNSRFQPSVLEVADEIDSLGNNKALGPDEIAAELLKVGGCPMVVHLHSIIDEMVISETWPVKWKGGRIERLYKETGSSVICSNSRGLLISDHCSKVAVGLVKKNGIKTIENHLPASQFGGISGSGTDFPNHLYSTKHNSLCMFCVIHIHPFP